jgi:hypothetical protein
VTTLPCTLRPNPSRAEIERSLKLCDQASLEAMLRVIQARLGTPDERLGDMDFVQMIAHQLNNVLTARRVEEALRQLGQPPPPPSP